MVRPPGTHQRFESASFAAAVPSLHAELEQVGREPAGFSVSKRIFLSVHDRAEVARSELETWFADVYRDPTGTDQFGIFGTPEQVSQQLEALAATGATHLLLNPVTRYGEQLEAIAEIVGLSAQ